MTGVAVSALELVILDLKEIGSTLGSDAIEETLAVTVVLEEA